MQLVLILEDDVLLRAGMARSLGKLPSIEVIEAATLAEAFVLLEGLAVDLVLSDLQLADGTALDLLPRLVRPHGPIPIVVISGCLAEFAGQLPSGVEIRSKPMVPVALRELVTRTLGCSETRAPFALPDYVQLACYGRHSVAIELSTADGPIGSVTIRDGQAWGAVDAHGGGLEAFVRLLDQPDATIECGALVSQAPHNLAGSCEWLLMEAARILDERRAGRRATVPPPATATITVSAHVPPVVQIPPRTGARPDVAHLPAVPAPVLPVAVARTASRPEPDFDHLYSLGIDALIARRYRDALDALSRARRLRTTPTLEANLHRLRALGFE